MQGEVKYCSGGADLGHGDGGDGFSVKGMELCGRLL